MKIGITIIIAAFLIASGLAFAGLAEAVQTKVVVRAKAKDAKFIGNSMGGTLVIIKNSDTGEILSKGFTTGGTGDTEKIMKIPLERGKAITDEGTAKFEATVNIDEPVLATIEATGPAGQRQSQVKTSTQVWLIPGKNITGEGIILEFPGMAVDIMEPQAHEVFALEGGKPLSVPIKANIVMMCGCPLTPGGMWNSDKYEIKAIVKHDGKPIDPVGFKYAGKPNIFEGVLNVTQKGTYEVILYAFDPVTGNTGVDKTSFLVR